MAEMTLGLRNNNPGNIEYGPFAARFGGVPGEGGRFARFPTMEDGAYAMCELLIAYSVKPDGNGGKINTVKEVVERWCPPTGPGGENRTATDRYIKFVCGELGCTPNTEFDITSHDFLYWMTVVMGEEECGKAAFNAYVSEQEVDNAVHRALMT